MSSSGLAVSLTGKSSPALSASASPPVPSVSSGSVVPQQQQYAGSPVLLPAPAAPVRGSSGAAASSRPEILALEALSSIATLSPARTAKVAAAVAPPARVSLPVATNGSSSGIDEAAAAASAAAMINRSASPPVRPVSTAAIGRVGLHPSASPPRVAHLPAAPGVAIAAATTAPKNLFPPTVAPMGVSRPEASASVKSAASAAFAAAQAAAKAAAAAGGPAPGAHMRRPLIPGSLPGTSPNTPGYLPSTSPPPSASPPTAATATASPGPMEPPVPKQAVARTMLRSSLATIMRQLASKHNHGVQYQLVAGIQALRENRWVEAEKHLRKADDLYQASVQTGSFIARRNSSVPSHTNSHTLQVPTTTREVSENGSEELELTQPMQVDAGAAAKNGDGDAQPPTTASSNTSTTVDGHRSAFVAHKAAQIKACLAVALWKSAYYAASAPGATPNPASAASTSPTPTETKTSAQQIAEAQALFLTALELENGSRLSVWNSYAIFLCATRGVRIAIELLQNLVVAFQNQQENLRIQLLEAGRETEANELVRESTWTIDQMQTNLSLMLLLDSAASEDDAATNSNAAEAIFLLQDVLANNTTQHSHHLPAMNNYAILLMRQEKFAEATKLLELVLKHDPQNCNYWNNLAVCYESQLSQHSALLQGFGVLESTLPGNDLAKPDPPKRGKSGATAVATPAPASPSASELEKQLRELSIRDEALRKNVRYCYEKARFYEPLDQAPIDGTAAPSAARSATPVFGVNGPGSNLLGTSSYNWAFRLNLAQSLLSAGRNESNNVIRNHHYESAELILLSLREESQNGAGGSEQLKQRAEIYTALGNLHSAQSVSALSERFDGVEHSKKLKAQSLSYYAKALSMDPRNIAAWNQVSVLFLHSGEMKNAVKFLFRLLNSLKKDLGLDFIKVETPANANTYQELSASDLSVLSSVLPSARMQLASILCNYALSLQLSSNVVDSEKAYLDSIRIEPEQATTYMNLGNLYRSLNRTEEALKSFSRALLLRPEHGMTLCNIALVYAQLSDWKQANAFMEKAHTYAPQLACVRSNRAKLAIVMTKLGLPAGGANQLPAGGAGPAMGFNAQGQFIGFPSGPVASPPAQSTASKAQAAVAAAAAAAAAAGGMTIPALPTVGGTKAPGRKRGPSAKAANATGAATSKRRKGAAAVVDADETSDDNAEDEDEDMDSGDEEFTA